MASVFCLIDDRIEDRRLRERDALPRLSVSQLLTIEIVGEYMGLSTPTRLSFATSGSIMVSGFRPCAKSTVLLVLISLSRRLTSGR